MQSRKERDGIRVILTVWDQDNEYVPLIRHANGGFRQRIETPVLTKGQSLKELSYVY